MAVQICILESDRLGLAWFLNGLQKLMSDILLALTATLVAFFAVLMAVAFVRLLRAGPGSVSYLRRKRYGLLPWLTGSLPKTSGGSTLHELEGLELKASGGRTNYVRQTRAPTADV
jgi:hypothetical protein